MKSFRHVKLANGANLDWINSAFDIVRGWCTPWSSLFFFFNL